MWRILPLIVLLVGVVLFFGGLTFFVFGVDDDALWVPILIGVALIAGCSVLIRMRR
jgi:hypothetical protein